MSWKKEYELKKRTAEKAILENVHSGDTIYGGGASVAANAPVASVEDQTVEDWEKTKCPKFQIYQDKAGEFRFRLLARNGQNICHGEGYTQLRSCLNGVESVRKNVVDAAIELPEK